MIRYNDLTATGNEGLKGFLVSDVGDDNSKCLNGAIVKTLQPKIIPINYPIENWNALFDKLLVEEISLEKYELNFIPGLPENENNHWSLIVRVQPHLEIMSSYGRAPSQFLTVYLQVLLYDSQTRKITGYSSIKAHYFNYKVAERRCDKIIKHVFKELFIEEK